MRPLLFFVLVILGACKPNSEPPPPLAEGLQLSSFTGDKANVQKAEAMFKALGGKERWANLKSLYVKANHTEPGLANPYINQIWRDIDWFKIRIEQNGEDLQRIGTFNDNGGAINFVDQDTIRELDGYALTSWRKSHAQNFYVVLNRLAKNETYKVESEGKKLNFLKDDEPFCAFELNAENLPEYFIVERRKGQEIISHFTAWDKSEGFSHPVAGGPIDGNFEFNTLEWKPQYKPFEEAFEVSFDQGTK